MTIKLVSITYHCDSCGKDYESAYPECPFRCPTCTQQYYFYDMLFQQTHPITYTYTSGEETTMQQGIIKRINPTRTAILNNI